MRRYMVLDYETFSECDLKKSGAYEYSKHPSTELLCAAFRIGTREELKAAPTRLFVPGHDGPEFSDFYQALMDGEIHLVAHNALFEQLITANVFGARLMYSKPELQRIGPRRWHCTAAMSRSVGLPGKLSEVGAALGLKHQKDDAGHRLMLKHSKPRKPTKNNSATRHDNDEELEKIFAYCVTDVDTEVELFLRLPPLHEREREFWILDQRLNLRGFAVDRELVNGALGLIARQVKAMDSTIARLTGGTLNSARQRDGTLKYLRTRGLTLPDMRGETVDAALSRKELDSHCREILEIRDAVSRSSTAKYQAFEARTRFDGRARDNIIFFGAHTGRGSGTGLQPQNLFKRVMSQQDVDTGLGLIRRRDFHTVQALFEKPMELYASALRSCIVAKPGHVLDVGDFAQIEVRVLFWLAGHTKGLEALASGADLYIDMAASIYGQDVKALTAAYQAEDYDAIQKRQLGKQTVLGAGFGIGLGGDKFQATAKAQYGLDISLGLAQAAVRAYRERHAPVPRFWKTIEQAAFRAVLNPGKAFKHGPLTWRLEGDFLTVELPIGRRLSYFAPRLERRPTLHGETLTLTYRGIDSKTKRFLRTNTWGGKLTENVVQAVARDLLMESVARIERKGVSKPVLTVHDEIVAERARIDPEADAASHTAFLVDMAAVPVWAQGLPVKVEGWTAERYRK